MQKNFLKTILLLVFTVVMASCSKFQKLQKSTDIDKKYEAALAYYDKKDYYKANLLLEELIPLLRGRAEGEKAQLLYAYTHFYQRDMTMSSFYFKNFFETFPRSEQAEEAMYMYVFSLYEDSPKYNLDQTNTYTALSALQTFLNVYPNTAYREEINTIEAELTAKLEHKAYENAKLYYKLSQASIIYHKSALIAFDTFKANFPQSPRNEEIAYLKIETEYNLAKVSTEDKKKERYAKTIEYYENFIDRYPNSKYQRSAENLYDNARSQVGTVATTSL